MGRFLSPTKQKLLLTLWLLLGCVGLFSLILIPVQVDVLDLRKLPRLQAIVLLRWPIQLFDFLTQRRFAPRSEGFIVFPTLAQVSFAAAFDLAVFYLLACLIAGRRADSSPTSAS
jgi:hypothetical protein